MTIGIAIVIMSSLTFNILFAVGIMVDNPTISSAITELILSIARWVDGHDKIKIKEAEQ